MKRIAFLFALVVCGIIAYAQPRPGSQRFIGKNSQIYEDVNGKLMAVDGSSPGPVSLEQANVNGYTLSTNTVASSSTGNWEYMYLLGSTSTKVGSLLYATPQAANNYAAVAVTTSTDKTGLVGFALAISSTGSLVAVGTSGFVLALTTGTVNPGAVLCSTVAANGYMTTCGGTTYDADFAVALTTGTSSGGLTLIRMR
jgi:hypothetical protein